MKNKKTTPAGLRKMVQQVVESSTYRKAYQDNEFIGREELRPVRMQLEILKPEMVLTESDIRSTVVVFGSARIQPRQEALKFAAAARRRLAVRPRDPNLQARLRAAENLVALSRYYEEARRFGCMVTKGSQADKRHEYVIVTGGGPGIMEAANRGAWEAGGKSIGLNITLPHEQKPNAFMTPELSFQFHYFALRKMHFMMRARAMVAFPGGFGTFDELFEALTLVQTGKKTPLPIILVGKDYWTQVVNTPYLVEKGMIWPEDLKLIQLVETAEEAWEAIRRYWRQHGGIRDRKRHSLVAMRATGSRRDR
ncbi:MAG TPA: TIGR00730 family Rossman fold protein [Elusimicrobia bacterium]|nr:TIGR00730 family Rossman fold protein [Elusimicrobiota bacterium]